MNSLEKIRKSKYLYLANKTQRLKENLLHLESRTQTLKNKSKTIKVTHFLFLGYA